MMKNKKKMTLKDFGIDEKKMGFTFESKLLSTLSTQAEFIPWHGFVNIDYNKINGVCENCNKKGSEKKMGFCKNGSYIHYKCADKDTQLMLGLNHDDNGNLFYGPVEIFNYETIKKYDDLFNKK